MDGEGRASVDAVVDGNLEYGVLQEVVRRDSNKTMGEANAEAQAILKERPHCAFWTEGLPSAC